MARGPIVTTGLFNRNRTETAAAFDKDGWLPPADIGLLIDCTGTNLVLDRALKRGPTAAGWATPENLTPGRSRDRWSEHPMVAQASRSAGHFRPEMGGIGSSAFRAGFRKQTPETRRENCDTESARGATRPFPRCPGARPFHRGAGDSDDGHTGKLFASDFGLFGNAKKERLANPSDRNRSNFLPVHPASQQASGPILGKLEGRPNHWWIETKLNFSGLPRA